MMVIFSLLVSSIRLLRMDTALCSVSKKEGEKTREKQQQQHQDYLYLLHQE